MTKEIPSTECPNLRLHPRLSEFLQENGALDDVTRVLDEVRAKARPLCDVIATDSLFLNAEEQSSLKRFNEIERVKNIIFDNIKKFKNNNLHSEMSNLMIKHGWTVKENMFQKNTSIASSEEKTQAFLQKCAALAKKHRIDLKIAEGLTPPAKHQAP